MALAQMPLDQDLDVILDWFEFYVLVSEFKSVPISDIARFWDLRRNSEESTFDEKEDESADDDGDQMFAQDLTACIRTRMEFLGSSYPFSFSTSGESIVFNPEPSIGKIIYLFCLLISRHGASEIFDLAKFQFDLSNRVRDLFQACSTWAAASLVQGSAIAFGFPRPDHSNFIDALRRVYGLFGEGVVHTTPPRGLSSNPKDEGIDVIAWGHRADRAAGVPYVLGQVATGKNWRGKTVTSFVGPFHQNWFSSQPASQFTTAMFIPHCINCSTGATLTEQLMVETRTYGSVFYRYVLPRMAEAGVAHASEKPAVTVERISDFDEIKTWVSNTISDMASSL
ncbi:MAG: hypothetical protein V4650_00185 [Pseudomonadota bacterium]